MNIKTSNSATKNKLFLGFWFVMFASLILLLNGIFQLPVNKADELVSRLADTEKQITALSSLHARFLLNNDKEDNLFTLTDKKTDTETRQLIANINQNITIINNHPVSRNEAISSSLNEFSEIITSIDADLNNLILITRERGNKNSGLVFRWLELSRRMLNNTVQPNQDIQKELNKIKNLESDYLLYRNIKTLQDISITVEEIRNQMGMEDGGISMDDLDSYMVATGNLAAIERRMGHENAQGIIPELEKSLQLLPTSFATTYQLIEKQVIKTQRFWNIIRYGMIILTIFGFIYLFINVFSLIEPLRQMSGFTHKLETGELPEDNIHVGNLADMNTVKESLQRHVISLKEKFEFTRQMNQDVLDSKLNLAGKNDLLGTELIHLQQKILATSEKQAINDQDNLVRRYMNEGHAKFGDILRSKNSDMNNLGDAFVREMVKYLNALQGGFFIFDDSDPSTPVLKLISAFAYNRKKYLQQTINYGEGLVGSCAKERKYINLTDIPKGYITITSGLGDTSPDNLLLVPVMHENQMLGVLEIASLHKFKPHEIEFANEAALNLGSTLINTRNNQRTNELLSKSQQQALEMAEQEEEMRQNMEELKATQEESGRREEETRGIAEAIGNALMVMEYDLDGKIHEVNERFCLFLGKYREDIIGKYHHEIFAGSLQPDIAFWKEVQEKGHINVTETVTIGKKSFQILEHFTPVTNRGNITVKYINFATDGRIGNS